jgi:hypothetical protein
VRSEVLVTIPVRFLFKGINNHHQHHHHLSLVFGKKFKATKIKTIVLHENTETTAILP